MNKYIFRGKVIASDRWVYGNLLQRVDSIGPLTLIEVQDKETFEIETLQVKPESVGMLTPIDEKTEKDIYDGDIVKFHYFYQSLGEGLGAQESEHELIGVVTWGAFGWAISAIKGEHWEGYTGYKSGEGESYIVDLYTMNESSIHEESFELIGNITDHPHLLNPAKGAVINSMQNLDPNTPQTNEETKEQAAGQEIAATEQEAQEKALDSAEEGTTEG